MACSMTMLAILMAGLLPSSDADGFLQAAKVVAREEIENFLESELNHLETIQGNLLDMYKALPKNEHGRLEPSTVRYALTRYFMQSHGWHILGLKAVDGKEDTTSLPNMTASKVPSYIYSLFEKRLHGQGLNLHDLAAFSATLTDVIHKEVVGDLEAVYNALGQDVDTPVQQSSRNQAVIQYVARYMNGTWLSTMEELDENLEDFRMNYPSWLDTERWVLDLTSTHKFLGESSRNPFMQSEPSFDDSVLLLEDVGHKFGTFQNLECRRVKEELLAMEIGGTGRVPLASMYAGYWTDEGGHFRESVRYLEDVGALDHTDKKRVIIANYMSLQSNCMGGSSFYRVCCKDECESLLQNVEREVKAPSSSPARIAEIVSGLESDTVHAPRNLSAALLGRLDEIAGLSGGRVPLHSRMFAQWMHHAFPRECPFPHEAGTKSTLTWEQWEETTGVSVEATEEEMLNVEGIQEAEIPLPWTDVEELFAVGMRKQESAPQTSLPLRALAAVALLASLAVPLARTSHRDSALNKVEDYSLKSHLV